MADTYITLAIHTYDRAVALRDILHDNGIDAQLENVNMNQPSPACGVRVRVPEVALPAALRIVESDVSELLTKSQERLEHTRGKILISVDFSDCSMNAVRVGFAFASALSLNVELLHVFSSPYFDGSLSITDNFTLDIRDAETRKNLRNLANEEMGRFKSHVAGMIDSGELPAVRFNTLVREGLPEDVILNYTRATPPQMVVMGTRGVMKKASQLTGSVAAEVIDSCRVPVFTVPENFVFAGFAQFSPAMFFCNVDQHDLLAMDLFLHLFKAQRQLEVSLIPVNDRAGSKLIGRMEALSRYFTERYPMISVLSEAAFPCELRELVGQIAKRKGLNLLVVPNTKKNIFSRLFNPGIAHKVVFEADVPMLALPV